MHKMIASLILGTLLLSAGFGNVLWGAELKAIQTRKTKREPRWLSGSVSSARRCA
jgi:hypothetical protein